MKFTSFLAITAIASVLSGCSDLLDFNDGYQTNSRPNYYGYHDNYNPYYTPYQEYLIRSYTRLNPMTGRYEKCKEYKNNKNNAIRVHCQVTGGGTYELRPQPR